MELGVIRTVDGRMDGRITGKAMDGAETLIL